MENLEKDRPVVATEHIAPENHIKCDLEELREKIRLLLKLALRNQLQQQLIILNNSERRNLKWRLKSCKLSAA